VPPLDPVDSRGEPRVGGGGRLQPELHPGGVGEQSIHRGEESIGFDPTDTTSVVLVEAVCLLEREGERIGDQQPRLDRLSFRLVTTI
jgi:hypothetical protein